MRCIIPSCCNDYANSISQGITFYAFPTEPSLCMAWLKALNMENWKSIETSVICSTHFSKNDLYLDRNGHCKIHAAVVPIINTQNPTKHDCWMIPCDAKDMFCYCNLYSMTMCNKLDQAYETLTGLSVENDHNLPSYLCVECAQRLLNCIQFRIRRLRAHVILLETIKKHDHISLESLKSSIGNWDLFASNLKIKHNLTDSYDLDIKHVKSDDETENIERNEQVGTFDIISLEHDNIYVVKTENDEVSIQGNVSTVVTNDEAAEGEHVDMVRIKTEIEGMVNQDGFNDNNTTEDTKQREETIVYKEEMCDDTVFGEQYTLGDKSPFVDQEEKANGIIEDENVKNVEYSSSLHIDKQHKRLRDEYRIAHGILQCELCSYQTDKDLVFLNHLKTHAESKLLNCNMCKYTTNTKNNLKVHMKLHSDNKKYSCDICKKVFKVKHALRSHVLVHLNGAIYSCYICEKNFNNKNNLIRHLKIHSSEKPYSCDICKKSYKRRDHYKNHLKVHSDEKPYSCSVCNKEFIRQDHYKTHLEIHSHEEGLQYTCEICKQMFSRKSNLRNHMTLHSGEKPYSCEICKKSFRRNNNLQKHIKLHGKKPLSCDICKKCYSRKSDLKLHIQLHTYGTPYTCNKCKKVFTTKINLRLHLKRVLCTVKN